MKINPELKSHKRIIAWIEAGCNPAKIGAYERAWLARFSEFIPYMSSEELKAVYKIAPNAKLHHFCSEWLPNSRSETKLGELVPREIWGMTWQEYKHSEDNRSPFLDEITKFI